MRERVLFVFWLPAMPRMIWRLLLGRFFIFRNEGNEFLRYMLWLTSEDEEDEEDEDEEEEEEARTADAGKAEVEDASYDWDDFVDRMCTQLHEEVVLRQRRGEWV